MCGQHRVKKGIYYFKPPPASRFKTSNNFVCGFSLLFLKFLFFPTFFAFDICSAHIDFDSRSLAQFTPQPSFEISFRQSTTFKMGFDRNHPMETHYGAKLGLRIVCLLLATVGLGLGGYTWYFCFAILPTLVVSWVWNVANIIRRLVAPSPIHPGANVALDLLLWIGFGIGMIISWFISAAVVYAANNRNANYYYNSWYGGYINSGSNLNCTYTDGTTVCSSSDSSSNTVTDSNGNTISSRDATSDAWDRLLTRGRIGEAASAMATLLFIFHFVLFVIACVDTHRRRHPQRHPEYSREKPAAYSYPTQQTAYQPVQQPAYNGAPQQY